MFIFERDLVMVCLICGSDPCTCSNKGKNKRTADDLSDTDVSSDENSSHSTNKKPKKSIITTTTTTSSSSAGPSAIDKFLKITPYEGSIMSPEYEEFNSSIKDLREEYVRFSLNPARNPMYLNYQADQQPHTYGYVDTTHTAFGKRGDPKIPESIKQPLVKNKKGELKQYQTPQFKTKLGGGPTISDSHKFKPFTEVKEDNEKYEKAMLNKNSANSIHQKKLKKMRENCANFIPRINKPSIFQVTDENEYPCIMVSFTNEFLEKGIVKTFINLGGDIKKEKDVLETIIARFHHLAQIFYQAIVNSTAAKDHNGIVIAERSSFGHLNPTLADTGASFRINIGIIGKKGVGILAKCLNELAEYLKPNDKKSYEPLLTKINKDREAGKTKWSKEITKKGRQTNALAEILRNNNTTNLLAILLTNKLISGKTNMLKYSYKFFINNFSTYGGTTSFDYSKINDTYRDKKNWKDTKAELHPEQENNIKEIFGPIFLDNFKSYLATKSKLRTSPKKLNTIGMADTCEHIIFEHITKNKISGNKVSFTNIKQPNLEADYHLGSSSEEDAPIKRKMMLLTAKKVTVNNGKQALVHSCIALCDTLGYKFKSVKTDKTYYEFPELFDKKAEHKKRYDEFQKTVIDASASGILYVHDMNHCNADNNTAFKFWDNLTRISKFSAGSKDFHIFDSTSSVEEDMAKVIRKVMIEKNYPALIFINSGLKHETYDKLHYGTVRFFEKVEKNKKIQGYLPKFIEKLESLDGVKVSAYTHQMRRSIKLELGTPRISGIMKYLDDVVELTK